MPEPTQHRFQQLVRRLLGIKSGYAPTVLEEMMPTINVLDPQNPETYRLRGDDLFCASLQQVGSVGNFNNFQIAAAPNNLCVITSLCLQTDVTLTVALWTMQLGLFAFNPIFLGQSIVDVRADLGVPAIASPATAAMTITSSFTAAGIVNPIFRMFSGGLIWFPFRCVLYGGRAGLGEPTTPPSYQLQIRSQLANQTSQISVQGWTRYVDPQEVF